MEHRDGILRILFSIFSILAVLGGVVVFVLFIISLIIGGEQGAKLALMSKDVVMPIFIRSAALSLLSGLIESYIHNTHSLSIRDEE